MISALIFKLKSIPEEVQLFLRNAVGVFVIWQLVYLFYLQPNRILDDLFTRMTGLVTETFLQFIYINHSFSTEYTVIYGDGSGQDYVEGNSLVWMGAQALINIADACNGLNMYALFLGFIIAFPAAIKLKFSFGLIGLVALIWVNILRCVGLAILQIHYPNFTVFAHHYIFNVLTYAAVFGLWYWFTKKAVL